MSAAAQSASVRTADKATIAFACQPTRSSAVGSTSSADAISQSSANAGTIALWRVAIPASLSGSSGSHAESTHAETIPTPARNSIA